MTKSQRLRYYLELYWRAKGSKGDREQFYNEYMDKITKSVIDKIRGEKVFMDEFMLEMKALAQDND